MVTELLHSARGRFMHFVLGSDIKVPITSSLPSARTPRMNSQILLISKNKMKKKKAEEEQKNVRRWLRPSDVMNAAVERLCGWDGI